MEHLFLAQLSSLDEDGIKRHLSVNYCGEGRYSEPTEEDQAEIANVLKNYDVLIAYEHVGSWGCDSSSFFLLKNIDTGVYYTIHGGHCSCYGFEGQFDLEETHIDILRSGKFGFYTGGYDNESEENERKVKEFMEHLK